MPYSLETTLPVLVALAASLLVGWLMLLTQRWHGHLSLDSEEGVQKFHTQATPRIGGLPVLVGLIGAWALLPAKARLLMAPLLLAAIPAFASGFIEDLTKKVGVGVRLACTVGSGALACLLTGYSVRETGVWGLDWLLGFSVISIVFTALALGTMANAVNLIDGFNGLSAGSLTIMLSGMGWIALDAGDRDLALLAFVTAAAILGFALLNWPWGKIFLGDGGAYLAGFVTGWIGVLLIVRNDAISSWAPLMVCAYPLLEVFFSITRRRYRKHHPGHPDRLHLHSLVRRRVTAFWLRQASVLGLNSITGMLMWPASLLCTVWAVVFAHNSAMLIAGLLAFALLYARVYRRLVRFRWGSKRNAAVCASPGA
jgi:UDP-N-acetylmuramyl pentapeptide phosphotransferase/UDP-N-acetylglucosamine-1-phosphate transferase